MPRTRTMAAVMMLAAQAAWAQTPPALPAAVPPPLPRPPAVVAGRVFLDANANGRHDLGEPGIPGVRVTDGVGFVSTGPDGAWSLALAPDPMLPIPGTQAVAVCWPTGKWPTGRHWYRVKDLADPVRVEFGLREDAQKLPFSYLHVSDNHDWRAAQYQFQHETVNLYFKDARFIINSGDMGFGGETPAGMAQRGAQLNAFWARNLMPTFGAIGNHDTDTYFAPGRSGHEYNFCGGYVALLGPLRFSFDVAGVHFAFVDVIGDDKELADPAAAWLEKDLASLRPGARVILSYHYPNPETSERFMKVLRDHKIEQIHAGHNHAYVRWMPPAWPAPTVTAYARTAGAANVMVVDETGTHVAFFCDGCSSGGGAHSFRHSARCPVQWREHVLESRISNIRGQVRQAAPGPLTAAGTTVPVSTAAVYAFAEVVPGASPSAGIRIGDPAAGKPLEVTFTGRRLVVDGVGVPFLLPARDKALRLHVYAHNNMLTVWANDCFFYEKPVRFQKAGQVTAFSAAEGASLTALTIQDLKPDPTAKGYFCSCAHGAILWNPE